MCLARLGRGSWQLGLDEEAADERKRSEGERSSKLRAEKQFQWHYMRSYAGVEEYLWTARWVPKRHGDRP